jgi:nucleotide-binding universal stress UspA family protein
MQMVCELHKPEIRSILVPIDGSETSFNTARYALGLAKQWSATVTLLHVSEVPPFPAHLASLDAYYQEVRKIAQEWFDEIIKFPESKGIEINSKVVTGIVSVVGSIVEFAEREKVDLIVMGPKGKSKFSKLLLGSVTSGVTTYAHCPVLVVK